MCVQGDTCVITAMWPDGNWNDLLCKHITHYHTECLSSLLNGLLIFLRGANIWNNKCVFIDGENQWSFLRPIKRNRDCTMRHWKLAIILKVVGWLLLNGGPWGTVIRCHLLKAFPPKLIKRLINAMTRQQCPECPNNTLMIIVSLEGGGHC